MPVTWTPERVALLTKIYPDTDRTLAEIAEDIGATENAVMNKAAELRLFRHRWASYADNIAGISTPEERREAKAALAAAYAAGMRFEDIETDQHHPARRRQLVTTF